MKVVIFSFEFISLFSISSFLITTKAYLVRADQTMFSSHIFVYMLACLPLSICLYTPMQL